MQHRIAIAPYYYKDTILKSETRPSLGATRSTYKQYNKGRLVISANKVLLLSLIKVFLLSDDFKRSQLEYTIG